jgi:ABC-type branched-subunit amino acid transport system ATPase component
MDTIFDLREISYSYAGKIHALKDTCSRVGHGEISIISYNDSGKSTLLAGTRGAGMTITYCCPRPGNRKSRSAQKPLYRH